MQCLLTSKR